MHVGTAAPIGDPDPTVSVRSSHVRTAPASERLCDTVVVTFALWTVSCHAIVAAGRALIALLVLFAVVLAAALWLRRRWVGTPSVPETIGVAAPVGPPLWRLRIAGLVFGVAAALWFAVRPDVVRLWWMAVISLGVAAVVVYRMNGTRLVLPQHDRSSEGLLWLLAAAAVVVTLISHRPDTDDAFYIDVAVATADIPQLALLSVDTMHGIPDLPIHLPVYRVDSYELLNGAIAYVTGIPAIYAFHWVSAAFAALLVPLVHARLFRILTPRRWLAATATLVFVLIAAGETHRWYGNFSFVRMWQGKGIFLFVFMPLVFVYALRFAVRPNLRDWAMLTAAQIAAVGCSSSALWVAPVGAVMALCSAVRPSVEGVKRVLVGGLASVYVLGAAWIVSTTVEGRFVFPGTAGAGAAGVPMLYDALVTVLGDARLLIFGIAVLLTSWVFVPAGLARRFALICPLVALLGLLNPYLAPWVPPHITGPSYWRAMWGLPLPIMMTLVLTSPLNVGDGRSRLAMRRTVWVLLLAAFTLLVPRYSGLSAENGVRLGWPALKVPPAAYQWAMDVNDSVPARSHVAVPSEIDPWIVTLHHHVYPILVRGYLHTVPKRLSWEELRARMAVRRFLDSPELVEATPEQFRNGLDRFDVRAVCLVNSPQAGAARTILEQAGFRQTLRRDDYELWVRPDPGATVRQSGDDR